MHTVVKREPIEANENVQPVTSVMSDGSNLTNLDYTTVQSHHNPLMSMTPAMQSTSNGTNVPTQPIDMDQQEKAKLERKRLRNREAASKCRHRKMERITQLEEHVRELTHKNQDLKSERSSLKQQLDELNHQINSQPRLKEHLQHLSIDHTMTMNHGNAYHG